MASIGGRPLSAIIADGLATGAVWAGLQSAGIPGPQGGFLMQSAAVSASCIVGSMVSQQLGLAGIIGGFGL